MIQGTVLFVIGLAAALAGARASFLVIRGDRKALDWARMLSYLALLCAVLASVLLLGLIVFERYDVAYVYQYTSSDLSLAYRLSTFWAGQQGSFLLWLLLGSLFTVLQIRRARQFEPYVLLFLLLVQAGLLVFLLVDSPFRLLGQSPEDGFGLNPLLQNPWMVAHPPVLFVGYAGLAVPFAYALAGLWRRDYDEWVVRSWAWALAGWFFLGLGIYLGAYWAYETLGWGGYWGWDLVENSSLIPWITGTALLHGMIIQRYRRRLRHGNFILAIATFLLILYATYLTRSGILSEISTHSFVESGLSPWIIGLIALMTALGGGFLVSRWRDVPRSPVLASPREETDLLEGDAVGTVGTTGRSWFSRDFTFLLTLFVLVLLAAPIWVGSLVPVVSQIWGLPDALDTAFYPRTTAPVLGVMLAVLLLCPLLGWKESGWERLRRFLALPAVFALAISVAAYVLGAREPLPLLLILLSAFALASNVAMLWRTLRAGLLRLGGYLAHVGLGLLIIGIVVSSAYSVDDLPSLSLVAEEPREALGYRFTFVGPQESPGAHPALRLDVERDGQVYTALPEFYQNPQDGSWVATPHVRRFLTHDLYIAVEEYQASEGELQVDLTEGDVVSLAGYTLTLRSIRTTDLAAEIAVHAQTADAAATVTPTFALTEGVGANPRAFLPGGGMVTVGDLYLPPQGSLLLIEGWPLSVPPYTVTLRGFAMHQTDAAEQVEAGAVLEFVGPEGTTVITPVQRVDPEGVSVVSAPVTLTSGITVSIDRLSVDIRAAQIRLEGLEELPRRFAFATLQVQGAQPGGGVTRVHVSVKRGMWLVWVGGILLLLGTAVATVRRWREGLPRSQAAAVAEPTEVPGG